MPVAAWCWPTRSSCAAPSVGIRAVPPELWWAAAGRVALSKAGPILAESVASDGLLTIPFVDQAQIVVADVFDDATRAFADADADGAVDAIFVDEAAVGDVDGDVAFGFRHGSSGATSTGLSGDYRFVFATMDVPGFGGLVVGLGTSADDDPFAEFTLPAAGLEGTPVRIVQLAGPAAPMTAASPIQISVGVFDGGAETTFSPLPAAPVVDRAEGALRVTSAAKTVVAGRLENEQPWRLYSAAGVDLDDVAAVVVAAVVVDSVAVVVGDADVAGVAAVGDAVAVHRVAVDE